MSDLNIIVEKTKDHYSAYAEGVEGAYGAGETEEEAKKSVLKAIEIMEGFKIESALVRAHDSAVDELEAVLSENPVECPIINHFTDGLYARECHVPAGAMLTSKIHKTEHMFILSKGKISVYEGEKVVTVGAPYFGITKPGTRRVAYAHTECVWTTFHANTNNENAEQIEDRIIEKRVNPLLKGTEKPMITN